MKASPFDLLNIPQARTEPRKRLAEMTKSERLEFAKTTGRQGGRRTARDKEHLSYAGTLGGKARHANGR